MLKSVVLNSWRARIAEAVRQVIVKSPENHQDTSEIWIGLGAPGLNIAETGVVHFSPNFPGWSDIPLVDYVNAELAKLSIPKDAVKRNLTNQELQTHIKGVWTTT